jgi:cyclic pyranopterin phosphate synthase
MRVSITDRCNLRCGYCMPTDPPYIPHDEILRYEEIITICEAAARLGIRTIKVTGGEPFVRKGCIDFLRRLQTVAGIEHVTLTTNGVLLEPYIDALAEMKIDGVNISLDTIDADIFKRITGRNEFHAVWRSLHKAIERGLPVKINCVPLKGVSEREILHIARLAEIFPVDVRFIELMPAGGRFEHVSSNSALAAVREAYSDLAPDAARRGFGPARYFKSSKLRGAIGFINAVTDCFCPACNRIRLTSEGLLKPCLAHETGTDLRRLLRTGLLRTGQVESIQAAIAGTIYMKPIGHNFSESQSIHGMSRMGG